MDALSTIACFSVIVVRMGLNSVTIILYHGLLQLQYIASLNPIPTAITAKRVVSIAKYRRSNVRFLRGAATLEGKEVIGY